MKNLILALLMCLAGVAMAQPSLTLTLTTATVETSTKNLVYPVANLYFTYNSTTGIFTAREVNSTNLIYSAALSTVDIDTFTTTTAVLGAIEATHFAANGGATTTYLPRNHVSLRQRDPYLEIWPDNYVSKNVLWSGKADSVDIATDFYPQAVAETSFLQTSFDISGTQASFATGAGIGTGGAITGSYGNQLAGHITIAGGTSPASSGALCVVTLPREFPDGFYVFLQERNANAAVYRARYYAAAGPLATRQFSVSASGTALPNSTTVELDYFIVGYTTPD